MNLLYDLFLKLKALKLLKGRLILQKVSVFGHLSLFIYFWIMLKSSKSQKIEFVWKEGFNQLCILNV